MAIASPRNAYARNHSQLFPANYYSRPALAPLYAGTFNTGAGWAQRQITEQYEYTMRQMALSPFVVNSEAYMDRIRKRYGYKDSALYDAFGTLGGVVGAGIGATFGAGLLETKWRSPFKKYGLQTPVQTKWTGRINPKRTATSGAFKVQGLRKDAVKYNAVVDQYNTQEELVSVLKTRRMDALKEFQDAQTEYKKYASYKGRPRASSLRKEAIDTYKEKRRVLKAIDDDLIPGERTLKNLGTSSKKMSSKLVMEYGIDVPAGTKISMKTAGLTPWIGLGFDVASLGISSAGLAQSLKTGDVLNTALNTVAVVGDTTAVIGDVVEFVLPPVGTAISVIGGLVSAGVSAIQGFLVGRTVGRSLSPEGVRAQSLFAANLYSSMVQRPLTTLATTSALVGVPYAVGKLGSAKSKYILGKGVARWMTNTALGNQIRAGASMMTLQALSKQTAKLDDKMPWAPSDPDDVNFVSAISLYGDINDNLYGATRYKSILLGLAEGDPEAMTRAMARSWGYSNEPYRSVAFDDVRQASGIDIGAFGNSVIGVLGEIAIDPQNWHEAAIKMQQERVVNAEAHLLLKTLDYTHSYYNMSGRNKSISPLTRLIDETGLLTRGKQLSDTDRLSLAKEFIRSYLTKGEKGLKESMQKRSLYQFKGRKFKGTYRAMDPELGKQYEVLKETLDKMWQGEYNHLVNDPETRKRVESNLRKYKKLKKAVAEDRRLPDEDLALLRNMEDAYKNMKHIHGRDLNENQLVRSFINETGVNLDNKALKKMYANFTDLRYHTDLSDALARNVLAVSNPMTKLAQGAIFTVGKWNEWNRRMKAYDQRATTIVKLQEIIDSVDKVYELKDLEEARLRNTDEWKEFESVQQTFRDEYKHLDDAMSKELEKDMEIHTKDYESAKEEIEAAKKNLNDIEALYTDLHEGHVSIPARSYENIHRKTKIYVDKENLKDHENFIKDYRENLTEKELNEKLYQDKHSNNLEVRETAYRYEDTLNAVLDYTAAKTDLTHMKKMLGKARTALSIMDIAGMELNSTTLQLLSAVHMFKRFVSGYEEIPLSQALKETYTKRENKLKDLRNKYTEIKKEIDELRGTLEKAPENKTAKKKHTEFDSSRRALEKEMKGLEEANKKTKERLQSVVKDEEERLEKGQAVNTTKRAVYTGDALDKFFDDDHIKQTTSTLDKILPLFGFDVEAIDKNGEKIEIKGLSSIPIKSLKELATLQLRFAPSFNHGLVSILRDNLKSLDLALFTNGIVGIQADFKSAWKKADINKDTSKKIDLLRKVLNDFDIKDSEKAKILDIKVLRETIESIDQLVKRTSNAKTYEYYHLDTIDLNELQAIAYQKSLIPGSNIRKVMNKSIQILAEINNDLAKVMSTDEYKNYTYWNETFERWLKQFNHIMHKKTAYKFFKSYMYGMYTTQKKTTRLFLDPSAKYELLPAPISKEKKEKIKKEKYVPYTAEQEILKYIDSPGVQFVLDITKADREGIGIDQKQLEDLTIEEITERATARVNKRKRIDETREENIERKKAIKKELKEALDEVKALTDITLNDISTLSFTTDFGLNTFAKSKKMQKFLSSHHATAKDIKRLQALFTQYALRYGVQNDDVKQVAFIISPSKAPIETVDGTTELKSYYKVLQKYKRSSPGHVRVLKKFAEYLVKLSNEKDAKGNKKIHLGVSKLVKLKRMKNESNDKYLARRIVETYKNTTKTNHILIYVNTQKNAQNKLRDKYTAALEEAVRVYMLEHSDSELLQDFTPDLTTGYSLEDISAFKERLSKEGFDVTFNALREIYKNAKEIYEENIHDTYMGPDDKLIRDLADKLHTYEIRDYKSITNLNYITPYDVVKKLMLAEEEFPKVLDDIINAEAPTEGYTAQTTLFKYLNLLKTSYDEDYATKEKLSLNYFNKIDYDSKKKQTRLYYTNKQGKESYLSLFNLMFAYRVSYKEFILLLNHLVKKNTTPLEIRNYAENEYVYLLDKYPDLLRFNNMDTRILDYSNLDFVDEDFNYSTVYRSIHLRDILETARTKDPRGPEEGHRKYKNYEYMPLYINEDVYKLWARAEKYAKTHDITPTARFVLELIRSSKVKENVKQTLLRRVFFHKWHIGRGESSGTAIKELQDYIQKKEDALKATKDNLNAKRKLEELISKNKEKLKRLKHIHDYYEHAYLDKPVYNREGARDYDKQFKRFYDYLIKNPEESIKILFNTIKTDVSDLVTVNAKQNEKDKDLYVLVRKHTGEETNFKIEAAIGGKGTGLAENNKIYGEEILKKDQDSVKAQIQKKLNESEYWQENVGEGIYVGAANSKGTLLVIPNDYKLDARRELINNRQTYHIKLGLKTLTDELYIVTEEQFNILNKMAKKSNYDEEYVAVRKEDGSIRGHVLNIINRSAQDKIDAYLEDLQMFGEYAKSTKIELDKFVKGLMGFAEKLDKNPQIKQAYLGTAGLQNTADFSNLVAQARVNKAFVEFATFIDPSRVFKDFDLNLIGSLFFRDDLIKETNSELFNVENLSDVITDQKYLQELKDIRVDGVSLFARVQKAIVHMQEIYGESNTPLNFSEVLKDSFIEDIRKLTNSTADFITQLKTTSYAQYKMIMKRVESSLKNTMETTYSVDELRTRDTLYKKVSSILRDNKNRYKKEVKTPYSNTIDYEKREQEKIITKLKTDFSGYADPNTGQTNEDVIARQFRVNREVEQERTKRRNQRKRKTKSAWINFKAFWEYYNFLNKRTEKKHYKPLQYTNPEIIKEIKTLIEPLTKDYKDGANGWLSFLTRNTLNAYLKNMQLYYSSPSYNEQVNKAMAMVMQDLLQASQLKGPERAKADEEVQKKFTQVFNKIVQAEKDLMKTRTKTPLKSFRTRLNYFNREKGEPINPNTPFASVHYADIMLKELAKRNISVPEKTEIKLKKLLDELIDDVENQIYYNKAINMKKKPIETKEEKVFPYKNIRELIESTVPPEKQSLYTSVFNLISTRFEDFSANDNIEFWKEYMKLPDDNKSLNDLVDPEFIENLELLKKRYAKKADNKNEFKDAYEIFTLMSHPVLNDDKNFKKFVRDYFFDNLSDDTPLTQVPPKVKYYLKLFGIKEIQQYTLFFTDSYSIRRTFKTLSHTINKKEMYALVSVLNMLKEMYIIADLNPERFWFDAHKAYIRDPLWNATKHLRELKAINITGGKNKKDIWENELTKNLYKTSTALLGNLSEVRDRNKLVQSVITNDTHIKHEKSIKASYLTLTENNIETITRQFSRKIYNNLFVPEHGISPDAEQRLVYLQLQRDVIHDSIAEEYATTLDRVGSVGIYQDIRKIFTEVMDLLTLQHEKPFVKIREIGYALGLLRDDYDAQYFWKREYKKQTLKIVDTDKLKQIDEGLEKIVRFFSSKSYLVNIDLAATKALFGRLLFEKNVIDKKGIEETMKEFQKHAESLIEAKSVEALNTHASIAYALNPGRDLDELSRIINEGQTIEDLNDLLKNQDIDKKEKSEIKRKIETIEQAAALHKMVDTNMLFNYERSFDNYDHVIKLTKPGKYEETNAGRVYLNMMIRLDNLKDERERIKASNKTYRRYHGTKEEAKIKQQTTQTGLDKTDEEIKKKEEHLKVLETKKEEEKAAIIKSYVLAHPKLIETYIETLEKTYTTLSEELTAVEASLYKDDEGNAIPEAVVDKYIERKKMMDKVNWNKKGKEAGYWNRKPTKIYNEIKKNYGSTITEMSSYVYSLYETDLEKYNIKSLAAFEKWFGKQEGERQEVREIEKVLKKTPYVAVEKEGKKKRIEYNRYEKIIDKHQKKIDRIKKDLRESLYTGEDMSIEDIPMNIRQSIVTEYLYKILEKKKNEKKESIKQIFDGKKVEALNPKLLDTLKDKITKQGIKHLEKIEKLYKDANEILETDIEDNKVLIKKLKEHLKSLTKDKTKKVDPNVPKIKKIIKNIETYEAYVKHNDEILKHLDKTKSETEKEALVRIGTSFFKDQEIKITDKAIEDFAKYLTGEYTIELRADIKETQKELDELKADKKTHNSVKKALVNYLEVNQKRLEELQGEIRSLQNKAARQKKKHDRLFKENKEAMPGYSNSVVFKTLYGLQNKSDQEVLDYVINESAKKYKGRTVESLRDVIKKAGDKTDQSIELHNPVVDVLIARMNYLKLADAPEKTFAVFDMETAKDARGNDVPYQLTILKEENGTFNVVTLYFNSSIFIKDSDEPNVLLNAFYRQQEELLSTTYNKDPDNVEDAKWIKNRTDALVKKIEKVKNNNVFVRVLIREILNKEEYPIVTHNGDRFDFPNFEYFITNLSKRLLTNLYYTNIKNTDIEAIRARLGSTSLGTLVNQGYDDKLITELQNEIKKTSDRLKEGVPLTGMELARQDKLHHEVFRVHALRALRNLEERYGWRINKELQEKLLTGTDSEMIRVRDLIYGYIQASTKEKQVRIKSDLISYFERGYSVKTKKEDRAGAIKFVEDLLEIVVERYNNFMNATKAPEKEAPKDRKGVLLKTLEDKISYEFDNGINDTKGITEGFVTMINQYEDTIQFMETHGVNLGNTIEKIEAQNKKLREEKEILSSEIDELENSVKNLTNNKENVVAVLKNLCKSINDTLINPTYRTRTTVTKRLREITKARERAFANGKSASFLKFELEQTLTRMEKHLHAIEMLTKQIDKDTEEIDAGILEIDTIGKKDKKIQEYTEQLALKKSWLKENKNKDGLNIDAVIEKTALDIKKNLQRFVGNLYNEFKELWNDQETHKYLVKDYKKIDLDESTRFKESAYEQFLEILVKNKNNKDNLNFQVLSSKLSTLLNYIQDTDLANLETVKDMLDTQTQKAFRELLIATVESDIRREESYLETLKKISFEKKPKRTERSLKAITEAFNNFIFEARETENVLDRVEERTIFNMLLNREKSTYNMNRAEFELAANEKEDSAFIEELRKVDPNVTRHYKNVRANDDKMALMLKDYRQKDENGNSTIYRTEYKLPNKKTSVTLTVFDKEHYEVARASFIEGSTEVTIETAYHYKEIGKELNEQPPKKIKRKFKNAKKLKEFITTFYDFEGVTGGLTPERIWRPDGIDHSYESIKTLVDFYTEHINFRKVNANLLNKLREKTISEHKIPLSQLDYVNVTELLEKKFNEHLSVLEWVRRGGSFKDLAKVYAGLGEKLLGKFSTQVPGKVLLMIPDEFSAMPLIQYDDPALLKKYKLNLVHSSEGSANATHSLWTKYTTDALYRRHTNTIRSILSDDKRYNLYTSNLVLNKLFSEQDKTGKENLIDYIVNGTVKIYKNKTNLFLFKDSENKYIDMFTPNALTADMEDKYARDILHRVGINAQIAFVEDPRAYEDTLLVDKDDAQAYGWRQGDKTWMSFYGFKGAVKFVKGLRATYGASFVASLKSVPDRGAYGVILELTANNIRKTLLYGKADVPLSDAMKDLFKKKEKEIREAFPIRKGKVILNPNKDYSRILKNLFDTDRTSWQELHEARVSGETKYYTTDGKEHILKMDNSRIYRGEAYVVLDSEHIASRMETTTKTEEALGIKTIVKDSKNSVRGGVMVSPSVAQILYAQVGPNWKKAFPEDTKKVEQYLNLYLFGVEKLIETFNPDGKRTEEQIAEDVKQNVSKNMYKEIKNYFTLKARLNDPNLKEYIELELKRLDLRVKNEALQRLDGRNGATYQSHFKRHEGVRQQLVANSELLAGELRLSKNAWNTLIGITDGWEQNDKKGRWLQSEDVKSKKRWDYYTRTSDLEYSDNIKRISDTEIIIDARDKKQFISQLNSYGILKENYTESTKDKKVKFIFTAKKQYYGYVLAVRSPVQDYGAVPMMKVIGFHDHSAAEATPHMYLLMGGDNDGDTIGMLGIGAEQYKHLKALDATKPEYYDEGYLERTRLTSTIRSGERLDIIDERTSMVGKNTFSVAYRTPEGFVKYYNVRKRYTWSELHRIGYSNHYKNVLGKIDKKFFDQAEKELENNARLLKVYINAYIRITTRGKNVLKDKKGKIIIGAKEYQDKTALYEFYNIEKRIKKWIIDMHGYELYYEEQIKNGENPYSSFIEQKDYENYYDQLDYNTRMLIEDAKNPLTYSDIKTKKEYEYIRDEIMFLKYYNKIVENTIIRIAVSKAGINVFGGNRKTWFLSSAISDLLKINKDLTGAVWKDFRLANPENPDYDLTVASIKNGLYKESIESEEIKELAKGSFQTFKNHLNKYLTSAAKKLEVDTYEEMVKLIYNNYRKAALVQKELSDLRDALKDTDPKLLIMMLKDSSKKNEPILKAFIEKLKTIKTFEVNKDDISLQLLMQLWFGKFTKTRNAFLKTLQQSDDTAEVKIKNIANSYINQYVLDRKAFREMSNQATGIIAVAKHFGVDSDSIKFYENYIEEMSEITKLLQIREVAYGEIDTAMGLGMAANSKPFENTTVEDPEIKKILDEARKDYLDKTIQVDQLPKSIGSYPKFLNSLLKENAKVELLGLAAIIPDVFYNEIKIKVNRFLEIINYEKDIEKIAADKEIEAIIKFFIQYNIPAYRIDRMLTNAYTLFREVNDKYHSKTKNKTLYKKDYDYLKHGTYFYELTRILYSRNAREQFAEDYENYPIFKDYMLNTLELDTDILDSKTISGDADDVKSSTDTPIYYAGVPSILKQNLKRMAENSGYKSDIGEVLKNASVTQRTLTRNLINNFNLLGNSKPKSLEDIISSVINEQSLLVKLYKNKLEDFKSALKNYTTQDKDALNVALQYLYGFHNIARNVENITKNNQKAKEFQKELIKKKKEIDTLKTRITGLDIISSKLTEHETFYKKQKKEDIIETLKNERDEYKLRKERHEKNVLTNALSPSLGPIIELLHTENGESIRSYNEQAPKMFSMKDIERLQDSNLMAMDKFQTPFLTFIDFFRVRNNQGFEEYDWNELYKWYKKNRRFFRLTVVSKAFDDETLVKRLNDIINKEDVWWETLTKKEKKKTKNILKRRENIRFKTYDDLLSYMELYHHVWDNLYEWAFKGFNKDEFNKLADAFQLKDKFREDLITKIKFSWERGKIKDSIDIKRIVERMPFYKPWIKIIMNKVAYDYIDPELIKTLQENKKEDVLGVQISPTLKEIDIKNAEDFKKVFEYINSEKNKGTLIGFTDLNSVMNAMELAYKGARLEGKFGDVVLRMQLYMKLMMRFNPTFLFRNLVDTWVQLVSEMYTQLGYVGMIRDRKKIIHYLGMTMKIYDMYEAVSQENLMFKTDINLEYVQVQEQLKDIIENKKFRTMSDDEFKYITKTFTKLRTKIERYIAGIENIPANAQTKRLEGRQDRAKTILESLIRIEEKFKNVTDVTRDKLFILHNNKDLKKAVSFLLDTRFAEFFTLYDDLKIDSSKSNGFRERIERIKSQLKAQHKDAKYEDFKHILFEISAFMNTNAQLDVYKQESFKHVFEIVENEKSIDEKRYEPLSYEELVIKITNETDEVKERLYQYITDPIKYFFTGHLIQAGKEIKNTYDVGNNWIESTARIGGYLFDRYLYGKQFDDTVNRSLKRWFNYGQRSPIELGMLADIPYLSFPVRSVDNWIERLTNPQYMRVMSDLMDGVYTQLEEDDDYDKQSNFTRFMMQNGWFPLGGGVGLRLGHGALDLQEYLSDPYGTLRQRTSPIIKGTESLLINKDAVQAMKSLATVGVITRSMNTLGPRKTLQDISLTKNFVSPKERTIGTTIGATFDYYDHTEGYEKYTPYKHRGNNGRYTRYENIYKNWFNKYGRMRKPKVNPYSLVRDIQWTQYVRYRQSQR